MPEWIVRMEERPEPRYAEPLTERSDEGVVLPIPTLPPDNTVNLPLTSKSPDGEVVPIPTLTPLSQSIPVAKLLLPDHLAT